MYRSLLLTLCLFPAPWLLAQEISFQASLDRNEAHTGEPVRLTITISNAPRGSSLTPPDLGGLVVLDGPRDQNVMRDRNGQMSAVFTRTWLLTATKAGNYTVGPATLHVGRGTMQSEPLRLTVARAEGSAAPSALLEQGQNRNQDLFCVVSLSRNKAYVGELVVATYTLYSRYNSPALERNDLPKISGFWTEEVDLPNASWDQALQTVNGLQYRSATIKKQLLIPQRSGKLRVEPMELTYRVNRSFFHPGTPITIKTNAAELNAQEQPPGAPGLNVGAVGDLQVSATVQQSSVKAHEAIDLAIRFTGKGNLKLIEAPKLPLSSDVEAYDPKLVDRITVNAAGMNGSREYQYLLVPRAPGPLTLGPFVFSCLDPATGKYRELRTEAITVEVLPGDQGAATTVVPHRTDVQALGSDIRYIRSGDLELRPHARHLFGSLWFVLGMLAPVGALGLFVAWQQRRRALLGDASGMRRRNADKEARRQLRSAEQALAGNDRQAFYTALDKALEGYFADRFGLGVAQVTSAEVEARLGHIDGGEVAKAFNALIDECKLARFAPLESKPRQQVFEDAVALVKRIGSAARA